MLSASICVHLLLLSLLREVVSVLSSAAAADVDAYYPPPCSHCCTATLPSSFAEQNPSPVPTNRFCQSVAEQADLIKCCWSTDARCCYSPISQCFDFFRLTGALRFPSEEKHCIQSLLAKEDERFRDFDPVGVSAGISKVSDLNVKVSGSGVTEDLGGQERPLKRNAPQYDQYNRPQYSYNRPQYDQYPQPQYPQYNPPPPNFQPLPFAQPPLVQQRFEPPPGRPYRSAVHKFKIALLSVTALVLGISLSIWVWRWQRVRILICLSPCLRIWQSIRRKRLRANSRSIHSTNDLEIAIGADRRTDYTFDQNNGVLVDRYEQLKEGHWQRKHTVV